MTDKNDIDELTQYYSKGKKIFLFIKKYWWVHTLIVGGLVWCTAQYAEIKGTERGEKTMRDSIKCCYKKIDSLYTITTYLLHRNIKQDSVNRRYDILTNDAYWYKLPYSQWGNQSK